MPKRGGPAPQPGGDGETSIPEVETRKMTVRDIPKIMMPEHDSQPPKTGPPIPHPLKRYYRLDEVAAYFAISLRTVYRLMDEGIVSGTKIRKCVRISIDEIKRLEKIISQKNDC